MRATFGIGRVAGGYLVTPTVVADNEAFLVYWPRVKPTHETKGVVFLIHGAGGGAKTAGSGGFYENVAIGLANAGYVVVASDFGSNGSPNAGTNPNTWGGPIAMAALDSAFAWVTGAYRKGTATATSATTMTDTASPPWRPNMHKGKKITVGTSTGNIASNTATVITLTPQGWVGGTPSAGAAYTITPHHTDIQPAAKTNKVILVGVSMGGWVAKNWASRNPTKVACIVDIAGVVDDTIIYTAYGADLDSGFAPAVPPSAPGTPTGTAGTLTLTYATAEVSGYRNTANTANVVYGDGPPTGASPSATLAAMAALNTTPNTIPGITHPAYNASASPIIGTRILRTRSGQGQELIDTVGQTTLAAASGTAATTTLTIAPLPFAIPNGCTLQLSHPSVAEGGTGLATTQNVTLSAAAAAGATTLTVTSFTPASGGTAVNSTGMNSTQWPIGTKLRVITYIDRINSAQAGYAPATSAYGASISAGAYGRYGSAANPSYAPLAATNLTASLKAIPLQYWYSSNDGTVSTATTPPTVPTELQTYLTAYGANMTVKPTPGHPVHALVSDYVGADATSMADLVTFVNANAP